MGFHYILNPPRKRKNTFTQRKNVPFQSRPWSAVKQKKKTQKKRCLKDLYTRAYSRTKSQRLKYLFFSSYGLEISFLKKVCSFLNDTRGVSYTSK